jgi:hypothetical protein
MVPKETDHASGCACLDCPSGRRRPRSQIGRGYRTRSEGTRRSSNWRANDGTDATGSAFDVAEETVGVGRDIAIAISVARSAVPQARFYIANNLPEVGKLVAFSLPGGSGQQTVACRPSRRTGFQSPAPDGGARSGCCGPHLRDLPEHPPVLSRSGPPGCRALRRLRIRFRPQGKQGVSALIRHRLNLRRQTAP